MLWELNTQDMKTTSTQVNFRCNSPFTQSWQGYFSASCCKCVEGRHSGQGTVQWAIRKALAVPSKIATVKMAKAVWF